MTLSRRALIAGAGGGAALALDPARAAVLDIPESMLKPGQGFRPYGTPSSYEAGVQRILGPMDGYPVTGTSRTPLHALEGIIVPNGLHFERHHNGVPTIDPVRHRLVIHGLVRRPLQFSLEQLHRYPMQSRIRFIECGGNSGGNTRPEPIQANAGQLHGLASCAEWTGVPLSILLDEAGVDPAARWAIAEGADGAALGRSVPIEKCFDDAIVALYQNGEAIRPEQGYPMRLLLPGFEGNMQIKWLHRLKLTRDLGETRDETSRYTELQKDGMTRQLLLQLGVKSIIVKPSFGLNLNGPGLYEISGLAWSGAGKVRRVELSADGGRSWADAALAEPVLSKAFTRFRMAWQWSGGPATLVSRAIDETGAVQPTRRDWLAPYAPGQGYHYNALQAWQVSPDGKVANAYV